MKDTAFDVNAKDESGSTPLHLAVARGKSQTVSSLISSGAEVNVKDNTGMDFNVVDDNNCSVLHHSCKHGSIDTVRYLVNEIGLNINQKDKKGTKANIDT
ncbi:putative ankyrin repeat protein RF_0381 [Patella vulgata]|uniref:putative ankyrin repeat protein RF_0381 n=1 Tax=Patella vulgata TaxID=6465 RepID=UPI0024A91209|nr:putative ankyrin repeat protein RF_0381 [Patella vulgata]